MGGMNSCCIPQYQNPNICRENHASTPKAKGHRRNLSAAFNLAEMATDISMEQMNINTATEEELMTLPGINRQTAINIVDYRRQIGGFKKVEDLALVSGVGATKLNEIRMEICVKNKKSSQSSSRSSSRTDMQVPPVERQLSSKGHSRQGSGVVIKVNINTANVFQLMKIKGISQLLAENIVAYRDKKGLFKNVDDLVKVKGVTSGLISAIRPCLILEDEAEPLLAPTLVPSLMLSPDDAKITVTQYNGPLPSSNHSSSDQASIALQYPSTPDSHVDGELFHKGLPTSSQDDLIAMYGPLLKRSFRHAKPPTIVQRRTRPVIRFGSWNLQCLNKEKAENPGVREVTCLTILENGLSILAVQEVLENEALQKVCDELNRPTIPNVKKWTGHRGQWKCVTSGPSAKLPVGYECLGFLYDSSVVSLEDYSLVRTLPDNDLELTTKPFLAHFKISDKMWTLCTLHMGCYDGEEFGLTTVQLLRALHLHNIQCKYFIVMGDISSASIQGGLETCFKCSITTEGCSTLDNGDIFIDSILLNLQTHLLYTGDSDVIQEGLTSPWIPKGWQWGGTVSDHYPLWVELYAAPTTELVEEEEETKFSKSLDVKQLAKPLAVAGNS